MADEPIGEFTHAALCQMAMRWLRGQSCGVVFGDTFHASSFSGEQPDAIGWRWNVSILVECKTSRADFLADKTKPFRIDPARGMGDWRFYLCPPGIVTQADLPAGWGLLHAKGSRVHRVHGVPESWGIRSERPFVAWKEAEAQMLYAAVRRAIIRGALPDMSVPLPDEMEGQDAAD